MQKPKEMTNYELAEEYDNLSTVIGTTEVKVNRSLLSGGSSDLLDDILVYTAMLSRLSDLEKEINNRFNYKKKNNHSKKLKTNEINAWVKDILNYSQQKLDSKVVQ